MWQKSGAGIWGQVQVLHQLFVGAFNHADSAHSEDVVERLMASIAAGVAKR